MQLPADCRQAEKTQEPLFSIIRECVPPRESAQDSGITSSIKTHHHSSRSFVFLPDPYVQSDSSSSSCACIYLSGLSFHLCTIPHASEHKCFINSPRDSSSSIVTCRWRKLACHYMSVKCNSGGSVSCIFSIILR